MPYLVAKNLNGRGSGEPTQQQEQQQNRQHHDATWRQQREQDQDFFGLRRGSKRQRLWLSVACSRRRLHAARASTARFVARPFFLLSASRSIIFHFETMLSTTSINVDCDRGIDAPNHIFVPVSVCPCQCLCKLLLCWSPFLVCFWNVQFHAPSQFEIKWNPIEPSSQP